MGLLLEFLFSLVHSLHNGLADVLRGKKEVSLGIVSIVEDANCFLKIRLWTMESRNENYLCKNFVFSRVGNSLFDSAPENVGVLVLSIV